MRKYALEIFACFLGCLIGTLIYRVAFDPAPASAGNYYELHQSIRHGKPWYEFPDVESLNGGAINHRYLGKGPTESSLYMWLRELSYRVELLEKGQKTPKVLDGYGAYREE